MSCLLLHEKSITSETTTGLTPYTKVSDEGVRLDFDKGGGIHMYRGGVSVFVLRLDWNWRVKDPK